MGFYYTLILGAVIGIWLLCSTYYIAEAVATWCARRRRSRPVGYWPKGPTRFYLRDAVQVQDGEVTRLFLTGDGRARKA